MPAKKRGASEDPDSDADPLAELINQRNAASLTEESQLVMTC